MSKKRNEMPKVKKPNEKPTSVFYAPPPLATAILDHQIWKASSYSAYEKIFSPVNVLVKMRTRNVVYTESPAMTWEDTKILFMGTSQPKRKLPLLSNLLCNTINFRNQTMTPSYLPCLIPGSHYDN
ncbi:hypothetical protein D5086_020500 [Populus alba]|uniref:Uncharacterized protein n=1 Tax=Populus alba TaxID=43335 RepID=A0ACC4BKV5_POPAL